MTVFFIIFCFLIFFIIWANGGYYLFLKVLSAFKKNTVSKSEYFPDISIIITAYNEEKQIAAKIENTQAISYPKDKYEIIVVSDGSSDKTVEIVRKFVSDKLSLITIPERHGKHFGQGQGIKVAKGEILVFSDATTFIDPNGIQKLVRNFNDPKIGCVSSEDKVKNEESSSGEGIYVKYEMKLRRLESLIGSLVGVSGSFFSVRKHLCSFWINNMSSDFYLPLITRMNGFRTIVEPEAKGYYEVQKKTHREFQRKVRTVVHGLEVLFRFKSIMNLFKYRLFSIQVISHKLCRWLVPFFMFSIFVTNIILFNEHLLFKILLLSQILFYLFAFIGYMIQSVKMER